MDVAFSQLCTCGQAGHACLQKHIDACAEVKRSYEFRRCRLFPGCTPAEAAVGFWRAPDGAYLVYLRPRVSYAGGHNRRTVFFARDSWRFPTFWALADCLTSLGTPAHSERGDSTPALFRELRSALGERIAGQMEALDAVAFKLYGHIAKQAPRRPLSLILYGPTGVGKSELAKGIAPALEQCLKDKRYQCVWTELNTFTEPHSVYRLTGAPPGYVGYDDRPVFEAVRRNPNTVFLFDELEKAHPEVLKAFMSILDEGRCAARREDEEGRRELDFHRCIFVFTTNADLSKDAAPRLGFAPKEQPATVRSVRFAGDMSALARRVFEGDETARGMLVRSGVLREIAGRFSGLIGFCPLDAPAREAVTAKQIQALGQEFGVRILQVSPALLTALTPGEALSPRSTVGILEGLLTPLLLRAAGRTQPPGGFQLLGTPEALRLLPAEAEERDSSSTACASLSRR